MHNRPPMTSENWLKFIASEPDCPITAGVPNERDALWQIQQIAAVGIESTEEESLLWNLFADIHATAAGMLMAKGPVVNLSGAKDL